MALGTRATERAWAAELHTLLWLLLATLLLTLLAYQVPFHTTIAIGGDPVSHRREDDAPFLRGFNASEPASTTTWQWWTLPPGYAYRWATSEAVVWLPGVGGGQWVVTLFAASGHADGLPAASVWQAGSRPPYALDVSATPRRYTLIVPADAQGDLRLIMQTQPYVASNDPRDLGFTLRSVEITPPAARMRGPAWGVVGAMLALVMLGYLPLRWLALARRSACAVCMASVAVLAIVLAFQRMALTLILPQLLMILLGANLLAGVVWLLLGGWPLRHHNRWGWQLPAVPPMRLLAPTRACGAVVALVLLAFVIRTGGMLHPHARFSDHRLNANNVLEVAIGKIFFTEGLPARAGGGQAPYPPGTYLIAAPALLVLPGDIDTRVKIVQVGTALLDSAVILLLWGLLRRAGVGQGAALAGAALYLVPPPMMASFSVGEYANLGGQVLALPALAWLALAAPHPTARSTRTAALILATLIALGLLGHFGVAISFAALLAAAGAIGVLGGRWLPPQTLLRPPVFIPAAAAGGLAAVAIYYSAPLFVAIFAQRLQGDLAVSTPPPEPLAQLLGIGGNLFQTWSFLYPPLLVVGIAGAVLLWRRTPRAPLAWVVLAWWGGTLLSLGLFLFARQGVRWEHFLYPALCLGAGIALHRLWRRGGAGRVVAGATLAAISAFGLIRWVTQIVNYLH